MVGLYYAPSVFLSGDPFLGTASLWEVRPQLSVTKFVKLVYELKVVLDILQKPIYYRYHQKYKNVNFVNPIIFLKQKHWGRKFEI